MARRDAGFPLCFCLTLSLAALGCADDGGGGGDGGGSDATGAGEVGESSEGSGEESGSSSSEGSTDAGTDSSGSTESNDDSSESSTEAETESGTDTDTDAGTGSEESSEGESSESSESTEESTDEESTDEETGEGETGEGETGMDPLPPAWLLSIEHQNNTLRKVDIFTGETEILCDLPNSQFYPSLTFSRENLLYASRGGTALDVIDPCTCEITQIGGYGGWSGVNGITADDGVDLHGVASTQDEAINIDVESGMGALIGQLGYNFGTNGATWSEDFDGMWAINGSDDWLYTIDASTGEATQHVLLDYPFNYVGIELSPYDGVIYACSSAGDLLAVDPDTGSVEIIGSMGYPSGCTNLAAPFEPVGCIGD